MRDDCTGTGAGELSETEDALGDEVEIAEAEAKLEVESLEIHKWHMWYPGRTSC